MKLILILAALLLSGNNASGVLKEVKPILEELGGEDVKSAFSAAEELNGILQTVNAFKNATSAFKEDNYQKEDENLKKEEIKKEDILQPIINIADKNTLDRLANCIAEWA
ncbi:MAG: hypothetical protein J6B04_05365 [Clostridia bacterium]|nr:hypothetical protein [Clostridia bacterium]